MPLGDLSNTGLSSSIGGGLGGWLNAGNLGNTLQPGTGGSGGGGGWLGSWSDPLGLVSLGKGLVSGIAAGPGRALYEAGSGLVQSGYNIAADVTGHGSQADWGASARDFGRAGQGVGDFFTGIATAAEGIGATLPGVGPVLSRDVFAPFNKWVADAGVMGEGTYNPLLTKEFASQLYNKGQGMRPQSDLDIARHQGIGAGLGTLGLQVGAVAAPVSNIIGGYAGGLSEAAASAQSAATLAADASRAAEAGSADGASAAAQAADAAAHASTLADKAAQWEKIHGIAEQVAHPFRTAGHAVSDIANASRERLFPPTITVADQAAQAPTARGYEITPALRDAMHPTEASAMAMASAHEAAYGVSDALKTALDQAVKAAGPKKAGATPGEEMVTLYRGERPGGTTNAGEAGQVGSWYTNHPDAAKLWAGEDGTVQQISVPKSVADANKVGNVQFNDKGDLAAQYQIPEDYRTRPPEAATKTAEAPRSTPQVEPAKYATAKGTVRTKGEQAVADETLRGRTAEARSAGTDTNPPLYVFDKQGRQLQMPTPEWARWVARHLPPVVNTLLGKTGYNAITALRLRDVYRNASQVMETAQRTAQNSPGFREGDAAAKMLLSRDLGRAAAEDAVGQELHARLNGEAQIYQWSASRGGIPPTAEQAAHLRDVARNGYPGVTDEMLAKLSPEERVAFEQHLQAATAGFRAESAKAQQTLLASRYGAKSLEAAILGPDDVPLSKQQIAMYQRSERDLRYAAKARERIPTEQARADAKAEQAVANSTQKWGAANDLRQKLGTTLQTITSLFKGVPKGMENDGANAIDATMQGLSTDGGVLTDVATGATEKPTSGIYVPLSQVFAVPLADWAAQGAGAVHDAIFNPHDMEGGYYDPQRLWGGADARLAVRIIGDQVVGTIAAHTVNGEPMAPWQAYILGGAHSAAAGFDFATGKPYEFPTDPMTQTLLKHYEAAAYDPASALNRWASQHTEWAAAHPEAGLTPDMLHNEMVANMILDQRIGAVNRQWQAGDIFKTELAARKIQPRPEYATNTAGETIAPAREGARRWGDFQSNLANDHANVDAIAAQTAAGAEPHAVNFSILDSFLQNEIDAARTGGNREQLRAALARESRARAVQDRVVGALNRADFTRAHDLLDRYAAAEKQGLLYKADAPAGLYNLGPEESAGALGHVVRGSTLENKNALGRVMTSTYTNADLTTLLQQDLHAFRMHAAGDDIAQLQRTYPHLQDRALSPARIADEQRFNADFMSYLRQHLAGSYNGPAADLFRKVADTMAEHYPSVMNTETGRAIPNEIVAYWDSVFNPDIVNPPKAFDPLSAQYAPQSRGANPTQLRGETPAAFTQRTRQYGEARGQAAELAQRVKDKEAQARAADTFANRMNYAATEPMRHEILAQKLEARANNTLDKLANQLADPKSGQVPRVWRPMMDAVERLRQEAKNDPSLAPLLEEIPGNFAAVLREAAKQGFDPTYMPDLTFDKAQKYLFGHLQLGSKVEEASLRKESGNVLSKEKISDRSLAALGAGTVIAMKEQMQSRLLQFVEANYARDLPRLPNGNLQPIPDGWKAWDPARDAIVTGRTVDKNLVSPNATKIIPDPVMTALDNMSKPYVDHAFRGVLKPGTNVWKHLFLTFSPSWYVKHFIGAVSLATLEGVRWQDWRTAFNQYRDKTLPAETMRQTIYNTLDEVNGTQRTALSRSFIRNPQNLTEMIRAEGYKVAASEVMNRMHNVVSTVDSISRAAVYAKTVRTTGNYGLAATRAYEALGDFGRLSPFERSMVTQVIPFYAFQKAMFRILIHLPTEHPLFAGLAMQLGTMHEAYLKDKFGGSLPDNYLGSSFINGNLVQLDKLNPLVDTYKLTTLDGIASSVNPFLRPLAQEALHTPGYNATAQMDANGNLVPGTDLGQAILSTFLGSSDTKRSYNPLTWRPGTGGGPPLLTDPGSVTITNQLSDAQYAKLIKRITKTQRAQATVANGGYLVTDAYKPKKAAGG